MSGGGGSQKTTTTQELSPQQQELLDLVIPEAQNISRNNPQLYPYSSIAGFTPAQWQGQDLALNTANNVVGPLAGSTAQAHQTFQYGTIPVGTQGVSQLVEQLGGVQDPLDRFLQGQFLNPWAEGGGGRFNAVGNNPLFGAGPDPVARGATDSRQNRFIDPTQSPFYDPLNNPFLGAHIEGAIRPLEQQFTRGILPNIRGSANESGMFGSSRQGIAEGLAAQGLQQQTGDITSRMQSEAFENNQNRALSSYLDASQRYNDALGISQRAQEFSRGQSMDAIRTAQQGHQDSLAAMLQAIQGTQQAGATGTGQALESGARSLFAAPTVGDLALMPSQIYSAVGAQQQGMNQNLLDEASSRYMMEQMMPFLISQEIANLAFGIPGGSVTSRASGGGRDPFETALGLGGLALGAFGIPGASGGSALLGLF